MNGLVPAGRWVAAAWSGVATGLAVGGFSGVEDDARALVVVATGVALAAAAGAFVALSRGRAALGGAALALSAGAPTFAAAALNLVPLLLGLALVAQGLLAGRHRSVH